MMNENPLCPKNTDLDSLEYGLDEHLPEFQRTDLDTVTALSFVGEILIGLGLGTLLLAGWFRAARGASIPIGFGNTYAGALEVMA